jgi:hypothetical protein
LLDPKKGFLVNGTTLKIYCQVFPQGGVKWEHGPIHHPSPLPPGFNAKELLSEEMRTLMDDPEHSDVTLVTSTQSFPTFKVILSGEKLPFLSAYIVALEN